MQDFNNNSIAEGARCGTVGTLEPFHNVSEKTIPIQCRSHIVVQTNLEGFAMPLCHGRWCQAQLWGITGLGMVALGSWVFHETIDLAVSGKLGGRIGLLGLFQIVKLFSIGQTYFLS